MLAFLAFPVVDPAAIGVQAAAFFILGLPVLALFVILAAAIDVRIPGAPGSGGRP